MSDAAEDAAPRPKIPLVAWSALLLIRLGLILIGLYFAARIVLTVEHEGDLAAFKGARIDAGTVAAAAPAALPAVAAPSPPAVDAAPQEPAHPPTTELLTETDARPIEGVLRVPSLALEVVIYEGTDHRTLDRGAGRIEGTAPLGSSGNVGVAAHRDGFFRPLKDIKVGDVIFVDSKGGTLRYEVASTLIVAPEDVWVLAPAAEPTLTLVTCYPFYYVGAAPKRFIVRATVVSADAEPQETSARLL